MGELHWIAVWVSFPRFWVSGIVFTSTKSTCFGQNTTYRTRVVDSEVALWLTRMSELSRFVYIRSHVTLHVKPNAETVNCMHVKCWVYVFSGLFG